jgi:hypothetical protein
MGYDNRLTQEQNIQMEEARSRASKEAARAAKSCADVLKRLESAELSGEMARDGQRVIRDERMALMAVMQTGTAADIYARAAEARRTAELWGV